MEAEFRLLGWPAERDALMSCIEAQRVAALNLAPQRRAPSQTP